MDQRTRPFHCRREWGVRLQARRAKPPVDFAKQDWSVPHQWRAFQRKPRLEGEEAAPDRVLLFETNSRKTSRLSTHRSKPLSGTLSIGAARPCAGLAQQLLRL